MTEQRRLRLSAHAVKRYRERVKPALDLKVCEDELRALFAVGQFYEEAPFERYADDVPESDRREPPDGYVELAPDIFAVVDIEDDIFVILTVLHSNGLSRPRRKARNDARRIERKRRQARRKEHFFRNGQRRTREEKWR